MADQRITELPQISSSNELVSGDKFVVDNSVSGSRGVDFDLLSDVFGSTLKVTSIAALEAYSTTDLDPNDLITVLGYSSVNDGGGGTFYWDSTSIDSDNGGTIIEPSVGGIGRWKRIYGDTVYVEWFGITADGTTDDRAKIQAAIDATPTHGKLFFPANKEIRLNSKLVFSTPKDVDFGNCTLILNNSAAGNNYHFEFYSTTESDTEWTQTIGEHSNSLSLSGSSLVAGDYVVVRLGEDPNDPNEEHWCEVCRVLSNNGTTVTIDQYTPYSINDTGHKIRKITTLFSNASFRNLKLDYVDGSIPDTSINGRWFTNVVFDNIISKNTRITFNLFDCNNVTIRNFSGTVTKSGISSHGRGITFWQVRNALVENVSLVNDDGTALIFLESVCRQCQFKNISLTNFNSGDAGNNLWQITGASYDIDIDGYRFDSTSRFLPIGTGGQSADYSIKNLQMERYPFAMDMRKVQSFTDREKNLNFVTQDLVKERLEIELQPNWTDQRINLCRGVVKNLYVYIASDASDVTNFFIINSNNQGFESKDELSDGDWVEVETSSLPLYGSNLTFNDPTYQDKSLAIYTNSSMPAGTNMTVVVEYWPIFGNQFTFPIRTAS